MPDNSEILVVDRRRKSYAVFVGDEQLGNWMGYSDKDEPDRIARESNLQIQEVQTIMSDRTNSPAAATAAPQQSDDAPASPPDYEKGFEAGCAFTVATLEDNLWHLNYVFDGRECCKRCALIKPVEGWTRPCNGSHELSLRAVAPNAAAPVEQSGEENG